MRPIFIGGVDRSGTTLLGSMLGAHPLFITTPESQFKFSLLRQFTYKNFNLWEMYNSLINDWRFRLWSIDPKLEPFNKENQIDSLPKLILWIVKEYAKKHDKESAKFWIDHTPSNLKYTKSLIRLFPNAKFIHLVRDGRAVAASFFNLDWGPNTIGVAAHIWSEKLSFGLASSENLATEVITTVRYEDLIMNPNGTMRHLSKFLDVDYTPDWNSYEGFSLPDYTRKQHSLVGKPIDSTRINAWKEQLSAREIEIFESITGDLLEMLGYTPQYGPKAKDITFIEGVRFKIKEIVFKYIYNKMKYKFRQKQFTFKKLN